MAMRRYGRSSDTSGKWLTGETETDFSSGCAFAKQSWLCKPSRPDCCIRQANAALDPADAQQHVVLHRYGANFAWCGYRIGGTWRKSCTTKQHLLLHRQQSLDQP